MSFFFEDNHRGCLSFCKDNQHCPKWSFSSTRALCFWKWSVGMTKICCISVCWLCHLNCFCVSFNYPPSIYECIFALSWHFYIVSLCLNLSSIARYRNLYLIIFHYLSIYLYIDILFMCVFHYLIIDQKLHFTILFLYVFHHRIMCPNVLHQTFGVPFITPCSQCRATPCSLYRAAQSIHCSLHRAVAIMHSFAL